VPATNAMSVLFDLAVMQVAKRAGVGEHVGWGWVVDVWSGLDVITHKFVGRSTSRYDTSMVITLVGRSLEIAPMTRLIVSVACHARCAPAELWKVPANEKPAAGWSGAG
jgi:hypothetical protein